MRERVWIPLAAAGLFLLPCPWAGAASAQSLTARYAALCDSQTPSLEDNGDNGDYVGLLADIRGFVPLAAVSPQYEDCLLRLPVNVARMTRHLQFNHELEYMQESNLAIEVVWGMALPLLNALVHRSAEAPSLIARYRSALDGMYPDDAQRQACTFAEFDYAVAYVRTQARSPLPDTELIPILTRSVGVDRYGINAECDLPYWNGLQRDGQEVYVGEPRLLDAADNWAWLILMQRAFDEARRKPALFNALISTLRTSRPEQAQTFVWWYLQDHPLLVPGPIEETAPDRSGSKFRIEVAGAFRAGDDKRRNVDLDLGPSAMGHKLDHQWIDTEYGQTWSQSDLYISGGRSRIQYSNVRELYELNLQSLVVGGYEPPWPSKSFPTRGKRDIRSVMSAKVTGILALPECRFGNPKCDPHLTVTVKLGADDRKAGADYDVTGSQGGSSAKPRQITENYYVFKLDLARGPAEIRVALRRADDHTGACCDRGWVEQNATIFVGDAPLGKERHWRVYPYFESFAEIGRAQREGTFYADLIHMADTDRGASDDAYARLYAQLFTAEVALSVDDGRLSTDDKASIDKARRILSAEIRDRRLDLVRQRIDDIRTYAGAVNLTLLDLAMSSLLEDGEPSTSAAVNGLTTLLASSEPLTPEERQMIQRSLAQIDAPTDGEARQETRLETLVLLAEARGSITHKRVSAQRTLTGLVTELTRLSSDCAGTLAYYRSILGTDASNALTVRSCDASS